MYPKGKKGIPVYSNGSPVCSNGSPVYPKGTPKYNLQQAKKSMKRSSPSADKSRASWNPALEKSLVELLHEYNTTYHRSQNGWTTETWNMMVLSFHERHPHVKFTKSQIQDKEKDLKRDYRIIKEARKQSGVGWNEAKGMIQAEPHLWENLVSSLGERLKKFKRKAFPLYESLGELYAGQLAEGKLCFTSTAGPSVEIEDVESDGEDAAVQEVAADKDFDEDLQIIDGVQTQMEGEVARVKGWEQTSAACVERNSQVAAVERNKSQVAAVERNKSQVAAVERNKSQVAAVERNKSQVAAVERIKSHVTAVERNKSQVAAVERIKSQAAAIERNKSKVGASRVNAKKSPKKRSEDGVVGVMERLVQIKEREATKEVAQQFTITRCMDALKSLEGVTPDEKMTALEVFENAHNREFFVNLVNDKDGTAIVWFRRQLARLT